MATATATIRRVRRRALAREVALVVLGLAIFAWLAVAAVVVLGSALEYHKAHSGIACPAVDAVGDRIGSLGTYEPATWSWAPLGTVCHHPDGSETRPTWTTTVALVSVAVVGGGLAAVWAWQDRRRGDWWPHRGWPAR